MLVTLRGYRVKDMVDPQGPTFFYVKPNISMLAPVSGKELCEISKGMQVIYKNIFQTEFYILPKSE